MSLSNLTFLQTKTSDMKRKGGEFHIFVQFLVTLVVSFWFPHYQIGQRNLKLNFYS